MPSPPDALRTLRTGVRRQVPPYCRAPMEIETGVFRERYSIRSRIESTNSVLENFLGLGKLRVRDRDVVFRRILINVSGWNLLRASASEKLRSIGSIQERLANLMGAGWTWPIGRIFRVAHSLVRRLTHFQMDHKSFRFTIQARRHIFIFQTQSPSPPDSRGTH